MAMLKRGSRLIAVDGVIYRWRVRDRPLYSQANTTWARCILAVERADNPGAKLIVELQQAHPDTWMLAPVVAVAPSDVADQIRVAIAAGWGPTISGSPFVLQAGDRRGG